MIVVRSMSPGWLSNSYLVADAAGGTGLVIDTGGPTEPILSRVEELGLTLTHVLCTHHHVDHVQNNDVYRSRHGCSVGAHAEEAARIGGVDLVLEHGTRIEAGDLIVRALHTPGHTRGQLAFVVDDRAVFTGDTLFRGSVGGTRAPGHATFADLRRSVMDVLMKLARETEVHPGHAEPTTVGREWDRNPFVRAWRGLDRPVGRPCRAFDQPATLLVEARDYDGGTKCWVRFADGSEDVVPGSGVRG